MGWLDKLPDQAALDLIAGYYAHSPQWSSVTANYAGGDGRLSFWIRLTFELLPADVPRLEASVWLQLYELGLSPAEAAERIVDYKETGRSAIAGRLSLVPPARGA